ncbi:hypothetical protein GCM10010343_28720 [Streptomyces avidinii]|nr:hypothetical protein GCM10010343_28720 [Streptomyces avidinii]
MITPVRPSVWNSTVFASSAFASSVFTPASISALRAAPAAGRPRGVRWAAMRKIVLMAGVSLDGFIEGPDRDIDRHRDG